MLVKDSPDSSSFLQTGEGFSQIASGPNSVTSTREDGNFINGPLSISSPIDSIKVGGIFRFNPMLSSCIPSTIVTPMPTLVIDLPIKNIASMIKVAALAKTLMG